MCGILGIVANRDTASDILEGLKRLEYRGYDSAGIATVHAGAIHRRRAEGKLVHLETLLRDDPLAGAVGIGHTRWATHGIPNVDNAHPHATDRVAVVHNGIIENFAVLRDELMQRGYRFLSQTDSEVVPVLITRYLDEGLAPKDAAAKAIARLEGAFALGIIFRDAPGLLIGSRHGAPLALGHGEGEMYLGSDAIALSHLTQRITYLEDGDRVELTRDSVRIIDVQGNEAERAVQIVSASAERIGKGNYRHYMLKEIYEQPAVVAETLSVYYNPETQRVQLPPLPFDLNTIKRVRLLACGTSYYAGLVAKYWLEQIARIPVEIDIASEFRYRAPILGENELTVVISQSGETADTLACLRYVKPHQPVLAVVNVAQSSIAREASAVLLTHAGPEIGVASTKAFTTQLAVLACLTLAIAETNDATQALTQALLGVSSKLADTLTLDERIAQLAPTVAEARDVLYLGRGTSYAIALEGALKLKEISYIHAEGYAAGEMKHGPIALIDKLVPIIALAPDDALFEKTFSNLQEAAARGGRVIMFAESKGCKAASDMAEACVTLPHADAFVMPLLLAVPVQLLAYHVAVAKGTDVDQPRNLAKSVTVE